MDRKLIKVRVLKSLSEQMENPKNMWCQLVEDLEKRLKSVDNASVKEVDKLTFEFFKKRFSL